MLVRRALAALLALPILAAVYISYVLRRGPVAWLTVALSVGAVAVVAAAGTPAGTVGAPAATQAPLAATALGPAVATGRGLRAAMIVNFDAAMDPVAVADAVRIEPAAEVRLGWSEDGTQLVVEPVAGWRPATYYTITVGTAARDREGRALAAPLRAAFLTRDATASSVALARGSASHAPLDTAVSIAFDRPVAIASVLAAFRISPDVPGRLLVATDGPEGGDPSYADTFVWEPMALLEAGTSYRVTIGAPVLDAEGAAAAAPGALDFATTEAPAIVRFRPRAGTEDVARAADVSVRFTVPMQRQTTKAAFTVEVNGKPVAGAVRFFEDDTVLAFDPEADFPYGATVTLAVDASATSKRGAPVEAARSVTFTVEEKPQPRPDPTPAPTAKPKPAPTPAPTPAPVTRPSSNTSLAAEKYLLTLMNRERAKVGAGALAYHAGISDKVARPYAKKLVIANVCSHFYGGTAGDRLRAAGYTSYIWAENLGCRWFADPRDAAESLVRFFLGSPGHYTNMVNRKYTHAGIGLWSAGGRLRFVAVYYTP